MPAVTTATPIYQFIARTTGLLPTAVDYIPTGNIMQITFTAAELNRRSIADVRSAMEAVWGNRYDRIKLVRV